MIDEYTGKKIVSPLDLPPEFVELTVTHYGTVGKDKVTISGSFKVPDSSSSSSEKQNWKDALSEIREMLKSRGLMIF